MFFFYCLRASIDDDATECKEEEHINSRGEVNLSHDKDKLSESNNY